MASKHILVNNSPEVPNHTGNPFSKTQLVHANCGYRAKLLAEVSKTYTGLIQLVMFDLLHE